MPFNHNSSEAGMWFVQLCIAEALHLEGHDSLTDLYLEANLFKMCKANM